MKYNVIKDTVVHGRRYQSGDVFDAGELNVDRLMLLGYLVPVDETPKKRTRVVKRGNIRGR